MSKLYLEITENAGDIAKVPMQVKIKVKDKKEAQDKLPSEEMVFNGLAYTKRLHICNHSDDGNNQPCSTEKL